MLVKKIVEFSLGNFGINILNFILENKFIFLGIFLIYGLIIFYSKIIYILFLPKEVKKIIQTTEFNGSLEEYKDLILSKWREKKRNYSRYILIPTNNEIWVKQLKKNSDEYFVLSYSRSTYYKNDNELINKMLKELNYE